MLRKRVVCLSSIFFILLGSLSLRAQTENVADALVLKVIGDAVFSSLDGPRQETPLRPRMKLREGSTIETGANSSVSLVFSNGSNLTIGANSRVELRDLSQVPFQSADNPSPTYGALPGEPSRSETEIYVDRGEVLGEVRGLNALSRFEVTSAVGTAGIRGTIFRVTITIVEGGVQMLVQNIQGTVLFESTELNIPQERVLPETGTRVVVTYDTETGKLTVVESDTVDIPEGQVIELRSEAQDLSSDASDFEPDGEPDAPETGQGQENTSTSNSSQTPSSSSSPEEGGGENGSAEASTASLSSLGSIIEQVVEEAQNAEEDLQTGTPTQP